MRPCSPTATMPDCVGSYDREQRCGRPHRASIDQCCTVEARHHHVERLAPPSRSCFPSRRARRQAQVSARRHERELSQLDGLGSADVERGGVRRAATSRPRHCGDRFLPPQGMFNSRGERRPRGAVGARFELGQCRLLVGAPRYVSLDGRDDVDVALAGGRPSRSPRSGRHRSATEPRSPTATHPARPQTTPSRSPTLGESAGCPGSTVVRPQDCPRVANGDPAPCRRRRRR